MITTLFKDPITFEVFKNALIGLADEMGLVTLRTSHSPILNQAMDFSTALCDADGQVLAQGNCMMIHLGTFPDAMSMVLDRYAGQIHPGDVYIFNDTDEVTQHLPDLFVIKPCFLNDHLLGFTVCTAHHVDVGGRTPGGMDVTATEIFQEGLQIPLVKLYERGKRNEAIMDLVMRNVRMPELYAGDLDGQIAALEVGEAGLVQLADNYSIDGFRELSRELLNYTERLTRAAIQTIPDGEYTFEDWLDDDGIGEEPIPIKAKVVVSGDKALVDWAGSSPQVPSALNCHITNTRSVTYGVFQGIFQGEIPSNEGFYRPITINAPAGSIVNSNRPAARGVRGPTCYRMIDALFGAVHQAVPDRAPAASDGGPAIMVIAGNESPRGPFVRLLGPIVSGWGGRPGLDGIDGISPLGANFAFIAVEETEQEQIVRFDHFGFWPDSGGAGRWRGSLSVTAQVRFLTNETRLHMHVVRGRIAPYGLAGGKPGQLASTVLNPGPWQEDLPLHANLTLGKDTVLRHIHAGGGGFGNPFLRDPQAVLEDVVDEKITTEHAAEVYGVAVDRTNEHVDDDRTREIRVRHAALASNGGAT